MRVPRLLIEHFSPNTIWRAEGECVVPIHRLLRECAFGPDEIAIIVDAYDKARSELDLKDMTDPVTELIARRIIEVARRGVRDPKRICDDALRELLGSPKAK
jgi:hypothetical protein